MFKLLILSLKITVFFYSQSHAQQNYFKYHQQVNEINTHISEERYEAALKSYYELFNAYSFIFLRDYKVASQLAMKVGHKDQVFKLIRKGIASGWGWKSLKSHPVFKPLHSDPEWAQLKTQFNHLHESYLSTLDAPLSEVVHDMFKNDQLKALGALFRIGNNAQIKHANRKFAPHSELQLAEVIEILKEKNYPGERLIGNNYWMSTIISHHNSISTEYAKKDTIYDYIKPMLLGGLKSGHLSPSEFAVMDDWRIVTLKEPDRIGYGFLNEAKESTLATTDSIRTAIGLPSVHLRNKLVSIQEKTGMDFYLTDWIKGGIEIISDN